MITNFISLLDFTGDQLAMLLDRAIADKAIWRAGQLPHTLSGKTLAMIFEKPSLRTRVSFETAMNDLGGHAIHLTQAEIGIGSREAVQDIARVIGRLCDGIMARTFSHQFVETMGRYADVPVVNALTDFSHPCQAMADVMTIREHFGGLAGKTITFVGDGNNVARSLSVACHKLGMNFILACPRGYELQDPFLAEFGPSYRVEHDPQLAVTSADCVYTDTWVSMGQEDEKEKRRRDFTGYQLNMDLMAHAPKHAIILHCLPAYRGFEITDEALEAHFETILDEAENRLHFQRTLLNILMGEGGIP
ncbi:MAG: ornithine carbamoyltransferase [Phycisphaerae bacterium]|nr:ornithine carbamoyltransferase [Phycisphaerae bacterium]